MNKKVAALLHLKDLPFQVHSHKFNAVMGCYWSTIYVTALSIFVVYLYVWLVDNLIAIRALSEFLNGMISMVHIYVNESMEITMMNLKPQC